MKKNINLILIVALSIFLSINACKKDETNKQEDTNGPSHEHSSNDGIVDNGNGTYKITLGNTSFTTKARDFSSETVVTTSMTVNAVKEDEYTFGQNISGFGIAEDNIIAANDINLLVYNMSTKKISDTHAASFIISGIDVNGAVMTTEGSESVNFYSIVNHKIEKHFFEIKSINGSKFLADCYLDFKTAYMYDESQIFYFDLDNATTSTKPKLIDIPDFAKVNYSSDENSIYFNLGRLSKPDPSDPNAAYINYSAVRIYDRSSKQFIDKNSADDEQYTGIVVDANYIYISLESQNIVRVINKHNFNDAGNFSVNGAKDLKKIGDKLYVYSSTSKSIIKFNISFN